MHTSASKKTYRSRRVERGPYPRAPEATAGGANPLDARVMEVGLS